MTVLRRVGRQKGMVVGALMVLAVVMCALLAPYLAPYGPLDMQVEERLQGPSFRHLCGTDEFGRDVFSRIVWGSRISLEMGLVATVLTVILGTGVGVLWGYYPRLGVFIARLVDLWLAFPTMLFAIVIVAVLGPSLRNAMLAVVLSMVPGFSRVVHSAVLPLREKEFVEAASAAGAPNRRILWRHVLPNVASTIIVLGTLHFASAILMGAALSFLGLGAQPPQPEWGAMINAGRQWLGLAWWLYIFPGIAIVVAVLGINLLGDGLRDLLDPRLKV
ncbi:MAG: ABC transporter permease [Firmicutes bacterium]|nr:ABC transporter permease [Bacillota bacterium]